MAKLSPARSAALALVTSRRRRNARIRDLARSDEQLLGLSAADRALAFRLAIGTTAAEPVLRELVNRRVRRPSSLEPKVRDALLVSTFEVCYLDTPAAVAASQGVELVRSVSPRAAGMANAVLRRLAREERPHIDEARSRVALGCATPEELSLVSGLPRWLVERVSEERGLAFACSLCQAQLEPAPVFVAVNARRHSVGELERRLVDAGLEPAAVEGLSGTFCLASSSQALASFVEQADLAVADLASQLVCQLCAPAEPGALLEIGQGRATKSLLLETTAEAVWPTRIEAVDSVAYKVRLSRRRMEAAGLSEVVACHELDGRSLADEDLEPELVGPFASVLLDAPCSGTGTMRRHPEIAMTLSKDELASIAKLQGELLAAAAQRVAPGGVLTYATCSVLKAEDEDVIEGFLSSDAGADFAVESVLKASACTQSASLAELVGRHATSNGYFLSTPSVEGLDGHFCVRLRRAG